MYDDDYLYISVFAFDREPDKLIRTELQRDFPLGNDDGTGVTIDTYHDKLTGMSFVTNTLNARWDAQITRDGDGMNSSFNTFWDAAPPSMIKAIIPNTGYLSHRCDLNRVRRWSWAYG